MTAASLVFGTVGGIAGCARQGNHQQNHTVPKQILPGSFDDLGRRIFLEHVPQRVVVIGPGALETVYALGAGARLVGRDQIADYPPQSQSLPVVGDYRGPFPEKVAALRPDFVIIQGETWDAARVEQWQREIGAPVAALTSSDLRGVARGIKDVGAWLGHLNEARTLSGPLESMMRPAPGAGALSAVIEIQRSPFWTAGGNTLVGQVLQAGGFVNAAQAAGLKGYGQFGVETLLAHQPGVYVVPSKLPKATIIADLRTSPVLGQLKCIREGRLVVVDGDLLLRPGPRLLMGIQQLQQQARALAASAKHKD